MKVETMSADTMTVDQHTRAWKLYRSAEKALHLMGEESLNLSAETQGALGDAIVALQRVDFFRSCQPKKGGAR